MKDILTRAFMYILIFFPIIAVGIVFFMNKESLTEQEKEWMNVLGAFFYVYGICFLVTLRLSTIGLPTKKNIIIILAMLQMLMFMILIAQRDRFFSILKKLHAFSRAFVWICVVLGIVFYLLVPFSLAILILFEYPSSHSDNRIEWLSSMMVWTPPPPPPPPVHQIEMN